MPQPTLTSADAAEAGFVPAIANGRFGRFSIDARGDWTYQRSAAASRLRAGQQVIERFEVHCSDGSVATVAITVVGAPEDEWPGPAAPDRCRDSALPALA